MSTNPRYPIITNLAQSIIGMFSDQTISMIVSVLQIIFFPVWVIGPQIWTILFALINILAWHQNFSVYTYTYNYFGCSGGCGYITSYIQIPLHYVWEYKNYIPNDLLVWVLTTSLCLVPFFSLGFKDDLIASSSFLLAIPRFFAQVYLRHYFSERGSIFGKGFWLVGLNHYSVYDKFWHELPFYMADFAFIIVTHLLMMPTARVISPTIVKYLEECEKQNRVKRDMAYAADKIMKPVSPSNPEEGKTVFPTKSDGSRVELNDYLTAKPKESFNSFVPIQSTFSFPTESSKRNFDSISCPFDALSVPFRDTRTVITTDGDSAVTPKESKTKDSPKPKTSHLWGDGSKASTFQSPTLSSQTGLNVTAKPFAATEKLVEDIRNTRDQVIDNSHYMPTDADRHQAELAMAWDSDAKKLDEFRDAMDTKIESNQPQQLFTIFKPNPPPPGPNPFARMNDTKVDINAVDVEKKEDIQFLEGKFQKVTMEVLNKDSAWFKLSNFLKKFRGTKVELPESTISTLYHEAYKWCEDRHMQSDQANECVDKALMYLVKAEPDRVRILQVINLLSVKEGDKKQA